MRSLAIAAAEAVAIASASIPSSLRMSLAERRRRRALGQREAPPDAEVPALEVGAGPQRSPEDRNILAHHGERRVEGESEHPLYHGAVTHADAEREAPARRLGERERGLGHRDRMARIDRDDAHAEAEARGGRPVRREDEERVTTETVGDPDALVAE